MDNLWNIILFTLLLLNYFTFFVFNTEGQNEIPVVSSRHFVVKRGAMSFIGNQTDADSAMASKGVSKTQRNTSSAPKPRRKNYTFATLLCDDKLLQATSVLVYSMINYAKTNYPITIMALRNVSIEALMQLNKLGAEVVYVDMLEYPFKVTPGRLEQNKPCRYSKLQLWKMTQFEKIIYMDSDMMAIQNIDSIFDEYDEFSAVVDSYPGIFNTGIFLLKPNMTTYQNMLATYKDVDSYNVGDQGYLNWYFGKKWKSNTSYHLPLNYNVLIKYRDSVIWPMIKDNIKVVHFTAETKPWNIHYSQFIEWKKHSDPTLYFKWITTRRLVDHVMGRDSKFKKLNKEIQEKCDAEIQLIDSRNLDKRFPIKDKFSVVLSTFDRIELAMKLIKHYARSKLVDRIFLIWHNPREQVPDEVKDLAKSIKRPSPTVYIIK